MTILDMQIFLVVWTKLNHDTQAKILRLGQIDLMSYPIHTNHYLGYKWDAQQNKPNNLPLGDHSTRPISLNKLGCGIWSIGIC